MRLALLVLLGGLGFLFLATSLFAADGTGSMKSEAPADGAEASPAAFTSTLNRYDLESHLEQAPSPWKSVLFSTLYPGLGQLNNGSWAKSTAFMVIGSLLVANLVVETQRADRYSYLTSESDDEQDAAEYYDEYSSHLERRDALAWWTVGFWVLNMLDAYVDGHLFSFSNQ